MSRIFISYRRDDAEGDAGRIADRLIEHFGEDAVFHDRQSLRDGERWRDRIDSELAGCELMLVVIGPTWEKLALPDGTPRLHAPDDIAAYEVASALARQIRLIPLLVRRTELPEAADLPAAIVALRGAQARQLHADAFGELVDSLIRGIEAAGTSPRRSPKWPWVSGAVALAALAVLSYQQFGSGAYEPGTATEGALPALQGDLRLRLERPVRSKDEDDEPRFLMKQNRPAGNVKLLLDEPVLAQAQLVEFLLRGIKLPLPREEYEVDLVPQPQSARLTTTPTRATLCLTRSDAAPRQGLSAIASCPANDRCRVAEDNPGHFIICGSPQPARKAARAPYELEWLPPARAEPTVAIAPAPVVPASAMPTGEVWISPSIETLQRRRAAGKGTAFTEVTLKSPPLPNMGLDKARQVSVEVRANGRLVAIDGLPPDASAVPFEPAKGLDLKFGLENLGFSGAQLGRETIELSLRFLDSTGMLREVPMRLDYVALRDHDMPTLAGDPALRIHWTARYFASSTDDRWQVFLHGASGPQGLQKAKKWFDEAKLDASIDGRVYRLVAVIRPPWKRSVWGLNLGLLLPSGQIRFTFDDKTSATLCGRLRHLALNPRNGVRADTYRRTVDRTETTEWCRSYQPRRS